MRAPAPRGEEQVCGARAPAADGAPLGPPPPPSNLTSIGQQSFIKELSSLPEMLGDVHLGKVIDLHTQVLNLQASVEFGPGVDAGAMSSIQDVSNPQPLQPRLVHSYTPGGREAETILARVRARKVHHP